MIIAFPLLIALIGLLLFILTTTKADVKEIGKHMFWTGLLAFMLLLGHGWPITVAPH